MTCGGDFDKSGMKRCQSYPDHFNQHHPFPQGPFNCSGGFERPQFPTCHMGMMPHQMPHQFPGYCHSFGMHEGPRPGCSRFGQMPPMGHETPFGPRSRDMCHGPRGMYGPRDMSYNHREMFHGPRDMMYGPKEMYPRDMMYGYNPRDMMYGYNPRDMMYGPRDVYGYGPRDMREMMHHGMMHHGMGGHAFEGEGSGPCGRDARMEMMKKCVYEACKESCKEACKESCSCSRCICICKCGCCCSSKPCSTTRGAEGVSADERAQCSRGEGFERPLGRGMMWERKRDMIKEMVKEALREANGGKDTEAKDTEGKDTIPAECSRTRCDRGGDSSSAAEGVNVCRRPMGPRFEERRAMFKKVINEAIREAMAESGEVASNGCQSARIGQGTWGMEGFGGRMGMKDFHGLSGFASRNVDVCEKKAADVVLADNVVADNVETAEAKTETVAVEAPKEVAEVNTTTA